MTKAVQRGQCRSSSPLSVCCCNIYSEGKQTLRDFFSASITASIRSALHLIKRRVFLVKVQRWKRSSFLRRNSCYSQFRNISLLSFTETDVLKSRVWLCWNMLAVMESNVVPFLMYFDSIQVCLCLIYSSHSSYLLNYLPTYWL